MTRNEARDIITARLGRRSGDTHLETYIVTEMNLAMLTELERGALKPWFLLSEFAEALTVDGENRVPLPTDFLDEYEEGCLYIEETDGTLTALKKRETDDALSRYDMGTANEGKPVWYSLSGDYFLLFPIPDAVYTLKMKYYQKSVSIAASNVENVWLKYAPDLVIALVGRKVATYHTKDMELAQMFAQDEAAAKARLLTEHIARHETNYARSMGDS